MKKANAWGNARPGFLLLLRTKPWPRPCGCWPITDYTSGMRQVIRYVDGSSIDNAMHEAKQLIRRHKP
ncbi:hypothetical protein [Delftia sp.]|uniref:hypothetical protein n=1 Tax=Delftia sp. TaxID=1886637 RepID=UPI00259C8CC4|nr:hypothetical protein [Delftia sp.]